MGILQRILRQPKLLEPADLSVLKVDMHSHLVPGIDDGAATPKDSLEMLERFAALGYKKVVTTPHIMSDFYRNSSDTVRKGRDLLSELAFQKGIEIEIEVAAEYYLDEYFEDLLIKRDLLTFGNNHLLFELAFMQAPNMLKNVVFELQMAGYKPVLAHPERYPYWHTEFEKYQEFIEKDVLLQLNINSLTGTYGPQVKKVAEKLIDSGMVQLLGSDCHHIGHLDLMETARRLPHLHKLLESGNLLNATL
jgi:tyrosine-protein phosphatase YwqE